MRKSKSLLSNVSSPNSADARGYAPVSPAAGMTSHAQQIQQHLDQFSTPRRPELPVATMPYGYPAAPPQMPVGVPSHYQNAPYPVAPAQPGQGVDLSGLKANLDRLASRLSDLGKAQQAPKTDELGLMQIETQMAVIANSVTELRSAFDKLQSDSVHPSQVVGLKGAIEQNYQQIAAKLDSFSQSEIDPTAYAKAVETSHANILEQVREIGNSISSSASPSQDSIAHLERNYGEIARNLENLNTAVSGLNPDQGIQQLQEQVAGLQAVVENLGATQDASGVADNSAVEMRLEEVTRAVAALSSVDRGTDNLERIEARIIEISRELDGLASRETKTNDQPVALDMSSLESYFSETNTALREIETRISGQAQGGDPLLEQMSAEVRKLGDKVDNISVVSAGNGSSEADNNILFDRLNELVERVEQVKSTEPVSSTSEATDAILSSLQEQVTGISTQLENFSGSAPSMDAVTQSLSSIEQQLGASRDISIELAATAAEEALKRVVHELPGSDSGGPSEAFSALQQDIKGLHEALHGSGEVQFDDLKHTLGGMAERLGAIETGIEQLRVTESINPNSPVHHVRQELAEQSAFGIAEPNAMNSPAEQVAVEPVVSDAIAGAADVIQVPQTHQTYEETYQTSDIQEQTPEDELATSSGEQLVRAARRVEQERAGVPELEAETQRMVEQPDDMPGSLAAHAHSLVEEQKADLEQVPSPELSPEILPEPDFNEGENSEYPLIQDSSDHEDMALEPGASGPDLEALVRQANERRKTLATRGEAVSGTDFLAAARQAAQAAAMEASAVEAETQAEPKAKSKSLLGSIPSLLSRKKKALIIAAAAALLVAVAVPIINNFALNQSEPMGSSVAALESEVVTEEVSDQPITNNDRVSVVSEPSELVQNQEIDSKVDQEATLNVSQEHTASVTPLNAIEPIDLGGIEFASDALKAAASDNDPAAFFEIGRRLTNGIGTEKNLSQAAEWYERAANLGYVPAQYLIGNFNEKGLGTPADRTMAEAWYEQASENGHIVAMHNLAVLNASPDPQSGKVDMAKARKWFTKAAQHGLRDSQVNLGIVLAKGNGVPVDLVESYKWFAVAAKSGDKDAANKRDFIADAMRPDQLEEARLLVKDWKQTEPDAKANNVTIPDSWKTSEDKFALLTDKQSIIQAQTLLTNLGFDAGDADGIIGQKTREAIMAFRSKSGLAVNDHINIEFMEALKAVSI